MHNAQPVGAQNAGGERRFQSRRGRGNFNRGANRGRAGRNRYQGNYHWNQPSNQRASSGPTSMAAPIQLAPLSAAKGVIKQKLSVMFRGLRGIEAAQAAFDMCGVEIGFHVNEREHSQRPSGNAGRGHDDQDRVPDNPRHSQSVRDHSPTEPNTDPRA